MYRTICEDLHQTMPNTISGDGQTQQHADNQQPSTRLALLLRDKSDSSRKMRLAMPITRPTVACVEAEAKLLAKTRNKTRRATVRHYRRQQAKGVTAGSETVNGCTAVSYSNGGVTGKRLLSDIIAIFRANNITKIRSELLIAELCADAKKPWATFCKGRNLHSQRLSALLKEFGIHSRDMRFDDRSFKGFKKEWFVDAKRRYKR